MSIAPEYFINFYAKLPPPGVFALIRDDGAILARFPDLSQRLEKLCTGIDGDAEHQGANPSEGFVTGTSTFDGHTRLFAYRKMPRYNIYVVSGIESEVIIRDWLNTMSGSHLIFGLPATARDDRPRPRRAAPHAPRSDRACPIAAGSGAPRAAPNWPCSRR